MHYRKLQKIAGSTYTISLPKEWVERFELSAGHTITVEEKEDGTLALHKGREQKENTKTIVLDTDEYAGILKPVLLAYYYAGYNSFHVKSKSRLSHEDRAHVQHVLASMSGVEITHEDDTSLSIEVLTSDERVNLHSLLQRIVILIKYSIDSVHADKSVLEHNEREVDKIYHLVKRLIVLARKNTQLQHSAQIREHILQYFLITKKLENIADTVIALAPLAEHEKVVPLLRESATHLGKALTMLQGELDLKRLAHSIESIKQLPESNITSEGTRVNVRMILRFIVDIIQEIVQIATTKQ